MKWLWMILPVYVTYYTCTYGMIVWEKENKFSGIMIILLGVSTLLLPILGIAKGLF